MVRSADSGVRPVVTQCHHSAIEKRNGTGNRGSRRSEMVGSNPSKPRESKTKAKQASVASNVTRPRPTSSTFDLNFSTHVAQHLAQGRAQLRVDRVDLVAEAEVVAIGDGVPPESRAPGVQLDANPFAAVCHRDVRHAEPVTPLRGRRRTAPDLFGVEDE